MKKAKRLSNIVIILIVVGALTALVFLATILIAPRYNKYGKIADNFFVAVFKDPPSSNDIRTEQAYSNLKETAYITTSLLPQNDYEEVQIKIYIVETDPNGDYSDKKIVTYTDANGTHNEEYLFVFKNVKKGEEITCEDIYYVSKSTYDHFADYTRLCEVVYYK